MSLSRRKSEKVDRIGVSTGVWVLIRFFLAYTAHYGILLWVVTGRVSMIDRAGAWYVRLLCLSTLGIDCSESTVRSLISKNTNVDYTRCPALYL